MFHRRRRIMLVANHDNVDNSSSLKSSSFLICFIQIYEIDAKQRVKLLRFKTISNRNTIFENIKVIKETPYLIGIVPDFINSLLGQEFSWLSSDCPRSNFSMKPCLVFWNARASQSRILTLPKTPFERPGAVFPYVRIWQSLQSEIWQVPCGGLELRLFTSKTHFSSLHYCSSPFHSALLSPVARSLPKSFVIVWTSPG